MNDELRQRVIQALKRGEDLPNEWARELFPPEKREYELVYHGKEREEDIIAGTMAVPLQAERTFGKNGVDWHNMLIFGDNLQVMKTLLEQKRAGKLCNADGTPGVRLVYTLSADRFHTLSTRQRQSDSVSAAELRRDKSVFFTDQTRTSLKDEQIEFFDEISEPGSGFRCIPVANRHDFKTPLNATIADSDPEQRFIKALLDGANLPHYQAWIKSTSTRFYEIDYAWKKGEHPKRGKFNPDFFIKAGNFILVVETKGNEELREASEENRKKNEYAVAHFERVNEHLAHEGSPIRYKFNFLTPKSFGTYFQYLREGRIAEYRSELDVKLEESN